MALTRMLFAHICNVNFVLNRTANSAHTATEILDLSSSQMRRAPAPDRWSAGRLPKVLQRLLAHVLYHTHTHTHTCGPDVSLVRLSWTSGFYYAVKYSVRNSDSRAAICRMPNVSDKSWWHNTTTTPTGLPKNWKSKLLSRFVMPY